MKLRCENTVQMLRTCQTHTLHLATVEATNRESRARRLALRLATLSRRRARALIVK